MKNETVKLQREKKTEMAYVEMKADAKNINRLFVWHGKSNPFFFFFQNVLIFPVVVILFIFTLSFKRIDFRARM